MRIGDIEYTRRNQMSTGAINISTIVNLSFALGIKIRPLLTRALVVCHSALAISGQLAVYFENGQNLAGGIGSGILEADTRLFPLWVQDGALVTSGFMQTYPFESTWWKILLPDVRLHAVSSAVAVSAFTVVLHYRFATLTDDEIIEIAAQRAQS